MTCRRLGTRSCLQRGLGHEEGFGGSPGGPEGLAGILAMKFQESTRKGLGPDRQVQVHLQLSLHVECVTPQGRTGHRDRASASCPPPPGSHTGRQPATDGAAPLSGTRKQQCAGHGVGYTNPLGWRRGARTWSFLWERRWWQQP